MTIDISSLDFEITDSIRTEVESLEKSLAKYLTQKEKVKVTLSKTAPDIFNVRMQTHYLGEDIVCDHDSHNFHKALELCKNHFVKLAEKRRDKIKK